MAQQAATPGARVFILLWLGQLVSLLGLGLTNFAMGVWVYQRTGSATQFALAYLFGTLPIILTLPLAGALADRYDRRWVMIFSNAGGGLIILLIAALLWAGRLEIWHVYLALIARSVALTFRGPAYTAAMTLLIPKQHFGRASGMIQAAQAAGQITPPLLAGILVTSVGVESVILIDLACYVFALALLLVVRIPRPEAAAEDRAGGGSWLGAITYGWNYIKDRPGLLALLLYFAVINFVTGFVQVLLTPMVLGFASAKVLGLILSISGTGFLAGSIVMSLWGGPKNRVHGVLGFGLLLGLGLMLAGLRPSATLIAAALFGMFFVVPIINGCDQVIWRNKTRAAAQGRVFATQRMIEYSAIPLANLIAGPLADRLFEPLLAVGGLLSGSVGRIIGAGPGRGIGLLFIIGGALILLAPLGGYLHPRLRQVEDELPDAITEGALSRV